jgi:hypothetical protein
MGMPGMAGGMGMGTGTPGGGNMFARQARTGARSRYVDTLNPNANDSTPVRLPYVCSPCSPSGCALCVSLSWRTHSVGMAGMSCCMPVGELIVWTDKRLSDLREIGPCSY